MVAIRPVGLRFGGPATIDLVGKQSKDGVSMSMSISPIGAATATAAATPPTQVQPQQVTAAVLNKAQGDGDGRKGTAALNDGDAAAQAAQKSVHKVDIKA